MTTDRGAVSRGDRPTVRHHPTHEATYQLKNADTDSHSRRRPLLQVGNPLPGHRPSHHLPGPFGATLHPILADPILEPWRWHPLPEVKGLGLLDILQRGPDDFWFASRDGLYHYNGRIKTRINLREGSVPRALALDTDRAVLVGSQFGISRITGGVSEKVFPSADDPACDVRDLAVDGRGDLWAATNWGLLRFAGSTPNPATPTLYTSRDQAESLRRSAPASWAILKVVDTDLLSVNPWTDGVGLRTRSGIVGQVAEGGPSDLAGIEIGDRILEIDGRPGDLNARLSGKPGQPAKILVLRAANGDTVHRVIDHGKVDGTYQDLELYSVFRDKAGAIWMSTSSGDILRFTPSAGTWDRVTETDGPAPFGTKLSFWRLPMDPYGA